MQQVENPVKTKQKKMSRKLLKVLCGAVVTWHVKFSVLFLVLAVPDFIQKQMSWFFV